MKIIYILFLCLSGLFLSGCSIFEEITPTSFDSIHFSLQANPGQNEGIKNIVQSVFSNPSFIRFANDELINTGNILVGYSAEVNLGKDGFGYEFSLENKTNNGILLFVKVGGTSTKPFDIAVKKGDKIFLVVGDNEDRVERVANGP